MNIILIGFMTAGKSTLGKILSKKLNKKHLDLDKICENKTTMKIAKIFEEAGENTFRQLETYYLKQTLQEKDVVIATGGGVVLKEENRLLIKKSGFVVWLKTTPEKVVQYASRNNNRPLLQKKSLGDIAEILEHRSLFYKDSCHFSLDTTEFDLNDLADSIIDAYEEHLAT